jgi:DivIVA domain-containing protein
VTIVLEILVVGAVVFVAAAYAVGWWEDGFAVTPPEAGTSGLPAGRIPPEAVDRTRFGLAFRGYRMAEVDDVLDRLRDELAGRDAEIDALRGHTETAPPETALPETAPPETAPPVDDSSADEAT